MLWKRNNFQVGYNTAASSNACCSGAMQQALPIKAETSEWCSTWDTTKLKLDLLIHSLSP